jgi:site-specific DNA recombinase
MSYTKEELQKKFFSRDLSGLNLAVLVRLSFEPKHDKQTAGIRQQKPVLSGMDINGRDDQEGRAKQSVERLGGRYVFTYDEPDTSAWKRRKVPVIKDGINTFEYRVVRPVYEGALEDLKRGMAPNGEPLDGLIVYDLDRLTRDQVNLTDAIDVVEHYGKLITDMNLTLDLFTDMGRSNASFLVTAKGMQSSDTARRVRDKHESIAKAGIPVGGSRPFGWSDDKRTLHPVESELLRKARRDLLYGGIGLCAVVREWTDQGHTTPKGNKWLTTTLRHVLLSPRLAGYRVYRRDICLGDDGKPVKGQHEPIFTVAEWEELRDFLIGPGTRSQTGHNGQRKYLLTGLVRCGLCGMKMYGRMDNRTSIYHYACPSVTTGGCGKIAIDGPRLDALVADHVLSYLADVEIKSETKPWPGEAALAVKEAKIRELLEAYHGNALSKEDVFPIVAQLRNEAGALKRDRSSWNRQQERGRQQPVGIAGQWPELSLDRQAAVVGNVIHTVAINARTTKQFRFDPERVEVIRREDLVGLSDRLTVIAA